MYLSAKSAGGASFVGPVLFSDSTSVDDILLPRTAFEDDYTTASIDDLEQELGEIVLADGDYYISGMSANESCRVRLYDNEADQLADEDRDFLVDPVGVDGLLFDYLFPFITDLVPPDDYDFATNIDFTVTDNLWITVQNFRGEATTFTVTFHG